MRILHLTTELTVAGAERIVCTLARAQLAAGDRVSVAGLRDGHPSRTSLRDVLVDDGIAVHSMQLAPSWKVWRLGGLRRVVTTARPDVIHAHLFHANVAAGLLPRRSGRPRLVWTHHDVSDNLAEYRQHVYRLTWRRPDVHVFVSGAVRDSFTRLLGDGHRHVVIPNGIDLAAFAGERSPAAAETRYGFLGRLERVKGVDLLLHAFREVRAGQPNAELHIAGGGPDRDALERLAVDLGIAGSVTWHGHVSDPAAYIRGVDVAVVPSRSEGFGLSLLEALASGTACAAFDLPALREAGDEAVAWARPGDVTALAEAMRRAPAVGSVDTRRRTAAPFTEARMLDAYASLYHALVERAR